MSRQLAGIEVQYTETAREGHGAHLAAALDLQELDGVLCVSGDGLVNEVGRLPALPGCSEKLLCYFNYINVSVFVSVDDCQCIFQATACW